MNRLLASTKLLFVLVILLAFFSALSVFFPLNFIAQMPEQSLPASKSIMSLVSFFIVLIIYGGLGFIGLKLSSRIDFPEIWDTKITIKNKIIFPSVIGIIIGIIFIIVDIIYTKLFSLKQLHPEFPFSIIASFTAGIGEEIIFRLFIISFWVWLISKKIFKSKHQVIIFWIVTIFSAISFSIGHIPSVMVLSGYKTFNEIPIELMLEIILLNGLLAVFCAYSFKKYGIISSMVLHIWTDIVWHIIWGAMK
jgi:hypothetical protein